MTTPYILQLHRVSAQGRTEQSMTALLHFYNGRPATLADVMEARQPWRYEASYVPPTAPEATQTHGDPPLHQQGEGE